MRRPTRWYPKRIHRKSLLSQWLLPRQRKLQKKLMGRTRKVTQRLKAQPTKLILIASPKKLCEIVDEEGIRVPGL
jgi:hypothetical protein